MWGAARKDDIRAVQFLLSKFGYSSKFYQSIQSENDLILKAPTCVLVPVILIYLGPFEMPAVQNRPVPFITHPQSGLKLLCFHLARRSFSGRINDHTGGALRFFIASGWLSDIAIPQRSARLSAMRLLTSMSGIRRLLKCSLGYSLMTPASVFAFHIADWTVTFWPIVLGRFGQKYEDWRKYRRNPTH